jgi:hypothetical protein
MISSERGGDLSVSDHHDLHDFRTTRPLSVVDQTSELRVGVHAAPDTEPAGTTRTHEVRCGFDGEIAVATRVEMQA